MFVSFFVHLGFCVIWVYMKLLNGEWNRLVTAVVNVVQLMDGNFVFVVTVQVLNENKYE